MPKIPYVIQQDRPNLVIVPTESCYEPSPKKQKLGSTSSTKVPGYKVPVSEKSVLVKNAGVNVKPRVSSVNNNVLIDVSKVKRQPNSWASNFLQSIGGSTSKIPRAYNWHSSAAKLGFLRNENIQPTNLRIAQTEIRHTTQQNTNKDVIKPKPNKEVNLVQCNKKASLPKTNNNFSASNVTTEITKPNTLAFPPKPNKAAHQLIHTKKNYLPSMNKESIHLKANKKVTQTKAKKETTQLKPTEEISHPKAKKEPTLLIANKKNTQTKATSKSKVHKEATKLQVNSETSQTKVSNKATLSKVHKEKIKPKILEETTKNKTSSQPQKIKNREKIVLKKLKVDEKKSIDSKRENNKKSKKVEGKKIKRDSSNSRQSISPLKSIVKKVKNYTFDEPQHCHKYELDRYLHNLENLSSKDSDVDLRSKLKRRLPKTDTCTKEYKSKDKRKHNNIFPTAPNGKGFVPDDNLIISFDAADDPEEVMEKKKPVKTKSRKHQSGGSKCKKIKLEINIVFEKNTDTSDDELPKRGDKEDYESIIDSNDLSFLDDFNVDEIVESLNDCQSNIVNTDNLNINGRNSKMDVDLPITDDQNSKMRNNESISKGEIIENNNTGVPCETQCIEMSSIKTEKIKLELISEVQSLRHNCLSKNDNENSKVKSENMLETQREIKSVREKPDKTSNIIGEVKTEFISKDCNAKEDIICVESVMVPTERKIINNNIPITTDIKPEKVNNSKSPAQLNTKSTDSIQKKNADIVKSTNIDNDKDVNNSTIDQNVTLSNETENKGKAQMKGDEKSKTAVNLFVVKTVEPSIFVATSKDDVILIEDSDNDCHMAEIKETQNLIDGDVIDLTFQMDGPLDTKCKEVNTVDAVKPNIVETDSEPILIIDIDYDKLPDKDDLKNKDPEPIDFIKNHLFCNTKDKPNVSDKTMEIPGCSTLLDHKANTETNKNQDTNNGKVTLVANPGRNKSEDVKIKKAAVKKITQPVKDKKDVATNEAKVPDAVTTVATKECATPGQEQAKTNTEGQQEKCDKKSVVVVNQISLAKENQDSKIAMQVINKGDTRTHNTVTQNQPKTNAPGIKDKANTNTQSHKDGKLNDGVKSASSVNQITSADENQDNITMWLETKISQDMKEQADSKSEGQSKGDTTHNTVIPNQPKANLQDSKDGKPKAVNNTNSPNLHAKLQPKVPNKTKTRALGNKGAPATAKQNKKSLLGDPTKQNQSKTGKCQPKVLNKGNVQAKGNNLTTGNLVQNDPIAERLQNRIRAYFGAKHSVVDLIHSGQYSTIYRCEDGSRVSKTVKVIKGSLPRGSCKEAMMMRVQNGVPEENYNCVLYFNGFSMAGNWCFVMDYYPRNLQEVFNINNRSFHIDKVQEFSRQLVAAVTILRNNNIIHTDINPQHILVNESETRLKLCGFDQAFYYNGSNLLPNVGSVNYRAPELILGFRADFGIDVWATALVIYEMATNRQLFPGYYNNDILYKQFCTVGNIPDDMLGQCCYRSHHFMGDAFIRTVGSRGEGKVLVHEFFKKERIHSVLIQVYLAEWSKFGNNRFQDKDKLYALGRLLNKMLVMDPRYRIAIEFVFADPFIYEMF